MTKITLDSQQMADLAVGLSSAVTWYERLSLTSKRLPVVDEGVRLHYQRQLDRLRELEKLLGSDSTGLAIVEVSRLPTPPGP